MCYAVGVDKATIERDLAQTQGHVSQGEKHIARQRGLIAQLDRDGHDTATAREFLDRLFETQALHVAHRNRLRRELDEIGADQS